MKNEETTIQNKKEFFESRAVIAGIITATAFLCLFTIFEVLIIKMEWNIPVMNAFVGGADSTIFGYYREEEEKLEASAENEIEESEIAEDETEEKIIFTESAGSVSLKENTDSLRGDTIEQESEHIQESTQENIQENIQENMQEGIQEDIQADMQEENQENIQIKEIEEMTESVESILEKNEHLPFYIKINRQQNVVTIYGADEKGEYTIPVKAILCSTGLYNATPKGVFHISSKYVWRELYGGVYGQYASRITGGILFHSVPYSRKNKSTLYWDKYNKLGQQASMGCVRLTVADAKWIYENCPSGTAVEIYDSADPGPLGKPQTLKLDKDSANKGWDPTDPDERNPWHAWSQDE